MKTGAFLMIMPGSAGTEAAFTAGMPAFAAVVGMPLSAVVLVTETGAGRPEGTLLIKAGLPAVMFSGKGAAVS